MPSRRSFLRTAIAGGAFLLLPRRGSCEPARSPNARLQLALIGVGGQGKSALSALRQEQIVAFCDVDYAVGRDDVARDPMTREALASFPQAAWFRDYRLMFERIADKIDAVVITVPDHMHFPIAMTAIQHGKHVYLEKPLCRCITEVRILRAAARAAGVVTQMGNQGRSGEAIRLAREWIEAGLIGEVQKVHAWTLNTSASYSHDPALVAAVEREPCPPSLDYDLWLGVAPEQPYRRLRSHRTWRGFSAYGAGRLGDWGCHQIDAANFALDLGAPLNVEAASTEARPESFPFTNTVRWNFPARDRRGPVELTWFDGGLRPPSPVPGFKFDPDGGSIFYGSSGLLAVASHSRTLRLLPDARMQELRGQFPARTIPRTRGGPYLEWLEAIRNSKRCGSNFDYAAPLTETILLGVAAIRAGSRLEWDADAGRVTNLPSANALLGPGYAYRKGWGV